MGGPGTGESNLLGDSGRASFFDSGSLVPVPPISVQTVSVGQVLHFFPNSFDAITQAGLDRDAFAAIVTKVWTPTLVNLVVFDRAGNSHGRTSVRVGKSAEPGDASAYCDWPERV